MSQTDNNDGQKLSSDEQLIRDQSETPSSSLVRENAQIRLDNADLKKRLFRVWGVVGGQVVVILLFVAAFVWVFPHYRYIPTTDNRAICQVGSEATARLSITDLTEFATEAALESNTYDYVNWRKQINDVANKYYTENGRKAFMSSLDSSGNLERVKVGKLILRSQTIQVAQLEEQGLEGVATYWIIHVPIAIEFYIGGDTSPKSRQQFLAVVKILQQTASAQNPKGIGVDSLTLMPFNIK